MYVASRSSCSRAVRCSTRGWVSNMRRPTASTSRSLHGRHRRRPKCCGCATTTRRCGAGWCTRRHSTRSPRLDASRVMASSRSCSERSLSMAKFTRGFAGRGREAGDPRLPPGQYETGNQWPVLTAEVTPKLETASWSFTVDDLVEREVTWTWDEIHALPPSSFEGDIHCVTTWSKLGVTFSGVSVDTLLEAARPLPNATHVLARSHTGYTTNLPLADVTGGRAWVVWD